MKTFGKVCDWAFITMWLAWMLGALVVMTWAGIGALDAAESSQRVDGRGLYDSHVFDPTNTGEDVGYGPGYDPWKYGVSSIPGLAR